MLGFISLLSVAAVAAMLLSISAAYAQPADLERYDVKYGDKVFEVRASMPGEGRIGAIQVFPEYGSIFLTLDADTEAEEGELRMILPRSLIDSKSEEGDDSGFLVIVDGEDVEYSELSSSEVERELLIPLPEGSFEIEIFGTQVLPEFHSGFVLLAAAVTAIIALIMGFRRSSLFNGTGPR
jgi:hypothetical protein